MHWTRDGREELIAQVDDVVELQIRTDAEVLGEAGEDLGVVFWAVRTVYDKPREVPIGMKVFFPLMTAAMVVDRRRSGIEADISLLGMMAR